jgi:hypothetical protein
MSLVVGEGRDPGPGLLGGRRQDTANTRIGLSNSLIVKTLVARPYMMGKGSFSDVRKPRENFEPWFSFLHVSAMMIEVGQNALIPIN